MFHFPFGVLSSSTPEYIASGKETIPAQVIKGPIGIELESSKYIVNNDEPVIKIIIVEKVTMKEP